MVPEHNIMDLEETMKFKNYNIIDDSNLPEISRFDPVHYY